MGGRSLDVIVLTLFPSMFHGVLGQSILGRAQEEGRVTLRTVDIRDFSTDTHKTVDDYPYGGGAGMLLKPEPVVEALEWARQQCPRGAHAVLACAQGRPYSQKLAEAWATKPALVLLCGHYEGIDERVRDWVDEEVSIGDFVLTGGEIPAMAIIDSVVRLLPGALGHMDSACYDSFSFGLLEGPQYTRPREFRGKTVPEVLLSGDHQRIRQWRRKEALRRTYHRRPDLLAKAVLTYEDRRLLEEIEQCEQGGKDK